MLICTYYTISYKQSLRVYFWQVDLPNWHISVALSIVAVTMFFWKVFTQDTLTRATYRSHRINCVCRVHVCTTHECEMHSSISDTWNYIYCACTMSIVCMSEWSSTHVLQCAKIEISLPNFLIHIKKTNTGSPGHKRLCVVWMQGNFYAAIIISIHSMYVKWTRDLVQTISPWKEFVLTYTVGIN